MNFLGKHPPPPLMGPFCRSSAERMHAWAWTLNACTDVEFASGNRSYVAGGKHPSRMSRFGKHLETATGTSQAGGRGAGGL